MNTKTFIRPFDDKPLKFIFKSLVRSVSEEEARELSLKYAQQNIAAPLSPRDALEVDLRPAFEKPLAEVQPKFASVPWVQTENS